ncbi:MAG: hypothetical protein JXR70_14395 [Spirochaetales bacterium]|nr:hypothetical protein [Spirochaetales bacterium]
MNNQVLIFLIILFFLLIVFIFFHAIIITKIFIPLGETIWILLNNTLFAIDQWVLWLLPIIVFPLVILFRLFNIPFHHSELEPDLKHFYMNRYVSWKSNFKAHTPYNREKIRKDLARILVFRYAIQKRLALDFTLYDDFKNKKIEIPEGIHHFLFEECEKDRFNFEKLVYQLSGQEAKAFQTKIEDCLVFIENYMELTNE